MILQVAREGNLLVRLDEYILRSAINEARTGGSLLQKPPAVAVNLGALNESPTLPIT